MSSMLATYVTGASDPSVEGLLMLDPVFCNDKSELLLDTGLVNQHHDA